jgi:cell division septation protein DedD
MVTFQAGRIALLAVLVGLAAACSREQQDWRAAEGADTSEAWQRFLEQHPDSELVTQARARVAQIAEQRDWERADHAGTMEAYRGFLAQHATGRWSEEARIRIEAFSLGSAPRTPRPTPEQVAEAQANRGVRALRLATAPSDAASVVPVPASDSPAPATPVGATAAPGEAAQPAPGDAAQPAPAAADHRVDRSAVPAPGYGVQLGAFGSEAVADREWQRLQGRFGAELGGLSPRIVIASTAAGQLYRLQAPAAGEAQARAICDSLKEKDQACVPVVPR